MSLQDDPVFQRIERERKVRGGLIRSALIWTPIFLVVAGALVFFFVDKMTGGERATWFLLVVLSIFALLFGHQSIQAIRDLLGDPVEEEGQVTRRWSRTDSFVFRSHYVRIGKKRILRIDPTIHDEVEEGDQVRVRYYPHASVVLDIDKVKPEEGPERSPF